jgi:hypothetical protein
MKVSDAVAMIRATPHYKRSEFASKLRSSGGRRAAERWNPAKKQNLFGFGTPKALSPRQTTPARGGIAAHMPARSKRETSETVAGSYGGYRIMKTPDGEFYSSLDPDSLFQTKKQVQSFIDWWKKGRGNPANAVTLKHEKEIRAYVAQKLAAGKTVDEIARAVWRRWGYLTGTRGNVLEIRMSNGTERFQANPSARTRNPSYLVRGKRYADVNDAIAKAESLARSSGRPVLVSEQGYGGLHTVFPDGRVGPAWELSRASSRLPNPAASQVRGRGWIQEWYETGSPELKARASELRKAGYRVSTSAMGSQVTQWGRLKMSLLDIRPGASGDADLERVNPGMIRFSAHQLPNGEWRIIDNEMGDEVRVVKTKAAALQAVTSMNARNSRFTPSSGRRGRRNPADAAVEVFEEFHGHAPDEIVEVKKKIHFHKHLAGAGILKRLVVDGIDGRSHLINGFRGALLCFNESKNQLFIESGDQAINLEDFGIKSPHELETLGKVKHIDYSTRKDHLWDEGGDAVYTHKFRTTNENGQHVTVRIARYPDLIYRVRDEQLEFSGGSYEIRAEGIDK